MNAKIKCTPDDWQCITVIILVLKLANETLNLASNFISIQMLI